MKKFCISVVMIFTLGFVYACEAKTEKKAEPPKQEEVKKEEPKANTVQINPQVQYVITKSDNGGWLVNVMADGKRLYTFVFDNKSFEEYWKKQMTPPKEETKKPEGK